VKVRTGPNSPEVIPPEPLSATEILARQNEESRRGSAATSPSILSGAAKGGKVKKSPSVGLGKSPAVVKPKASSPTVGTLSQNGVLLIFYS
jgi:hypothetical protein